MPGSFTASYIKSGAPYMIWAVVTGKQAAGVTAQSGSTIYDVSLQRNVNSLRISNHTTNTIVYVGGRNVSDGVGFNGSPITLNNPLTLGQEGVGDVSLVDTGFAPDTDNTVISIMWY